MRIVTNTATLFLSCLPVKVNDMIRRCIPNSLKRKLGAKIMKDACQKAGKNEIVVKDGRKFFVIEDRLFLRVIFDKDYEPFLSEIPTKLLRKTDVAIDVGANFGWYTTLFSTLAFEGEVISYEPAPRIFSILSKNVKNNNFKNVILKNICAGNTEGTMILDEGEASESGLAHVVGSHNETSVEVKVTSLDQDLKSYKNRISYMKIDAEGYEKNILDGATQILDVENQPIIQIELNEEALNRAGSSREETLSLLSDLGYEFWEIDKARKGFLKKSDLNNCSDVFCFGKGVYRARLDLVS